MPGIGAQDQPFERQLGGATKGLVKGVRIWTRRAASMLTRGLTWWGRWFKRVAFFVGVAIVVLLADRGLIGAWRREGLHALLNYVPLMLYVYLRLLVGSGVSRLAKALLLASIAYGVVRADLVPDRALIPGRVDDIVLIAIATRVFVFACPQELTNAYARRAISLRRRLGSQRPRGC